MINHRAQKQHVQHLLETIALSIAQPIDLPRETIEEALRQAIIDGRLTPGERLTQQAIANAFKVSRMA
ncbi:GntR family transcriptional regulator, partial [Pseudomonas savastanoi]|uniref:GntR family transcriptional regulator n=1 Tax=Pseudomonas savastanoi TaxID=29438 RepID=UPI000E316D4E